MIKLFSEKVNSTFTSSKHNVLTVESYDEVFFDVFEFEINGTKYIAEKLSVYKGSPVVSIPVVENEIKKNVPFVLMEGAFEVVYNGAEPPEETDDIDEIAAIVAEEKIDVALEYKDDLLQEIAEAKHLAVEHADRLKLQKIEEANIEIKKKHAAVNDFLVDVKGELLNEFNNYITKNKNEVEAYNESQNKELESSLISRIENNFSLFFKENERKVDVVTEALNKKVTNLVDRVIKEKVDPLLESSKASTAYIDEIEKALVEQNIELRVNLESEVENLLIEQDKKVNDRVKKGVDRALGRVGNVKTRVNALEKDLIDRLKIADTNIREYYDNKIDNIKNDLVEVISENQKDYFIQLVEGSKDLLLEQNGADAKRSVQTLLEKKSFNPVEGSKDFDKSVEKLKRDLESSISARFSREIMSLRRLIEYSGGGTVAKQFADGGVMRGDLFVEGCITAYCFNIKSPNSIDYFQDSIFRDGFIKGDNVLITFPIRILPTLATAKFQATYTGTGNAYNRTFAEIWVGIHQQNCYINSYSIINTDDNKPLVTNLSCSIVDEHLVITSTTTDEGFVVMSGRGTYVDDDNGLLFSLNGTSELITEKEEDMFGLE